MPPLPASWAIPAKPCWPFRRCCPNLCPRIALVDFNNDSVADLLGVCQAMFERYRQLIEAGQPEEAERYHLYGVRLDTSAALRDRSVTPLGDPALDLGVNPAPGLPGAPGAGYGLGIAGISRPTGTTRAQQYCQAVKIVVSGGFNSEKIRRFETLGVPVDIYAVGSSLFDSHGPTVTDFTADVVRVKVHGEWIDMAKIGRRSCDNPDLERVW